MSPIWIDDITFFTFSMWSNQSTFWTTSTWMRVDEDTPCDKLTGYEVTLIVNKRTMEPRLASDTSQLPCKGAASKFLCPQNTLLWGKPPPTMASRALVYYWSFGWALTIVFPLLWHPKGNPLIPIFQTMFLRSFNKQSKCINNHGHLDYFQRPPLGRRPNTKSGDHGTPNTHDHWFILFHYVWGPAWM